MSHCLNTILATFLLPPSALASGPVWEPGDTRCMPNFTEGRPVGYLCVRVEEGSLYARTGLRKGDNVTRINGESLVTDPDRAIDLWKEFEKGPSAQVTVERDGRTLELARASGAAQ